MTLVVNPIISDQFDDFFRRHEHLFPPPKKVGKNDWGAGLALVERHYGPVDFWYGRCFHAAKFMYYYLDGPDRDDITLMCCRSFVFCDLGLTTTHWFVKKHEDEICDPSRSQFIYGYPAPYEAARKADFGNPYFGGGAKKSKRYHTVVPTKTVIEFMRAFLAEGHESASLQWWVDEYDAFLKEANGLTISDRNGKN